MHGREEGLGNVEVPAFVRCGGLDLCMFFSDQNPIHRSEKPSLWKRLMASISCPEVGYGV